MEFIRIKNDVNGNPRYVTHFLNLLTESEVYNTNIDNKYSIAVNRSHKLGGRKYHTKSFGGGLVFSTYNLDGLKGRIYEITGKRDAIGCRIAQRLVSALTGNGIDYQKLVDIVYNELRDVAKEQRQGDWIEMPNGECYTRN